MTPHSMCAPRAQRGRATPCAPVVAYAFVPSAADARVSVIDARTGVLIAPLLVGGEPCDVAVTPDGRYAYITRRAAHRVNVIDVGTFSHAATIPVGLEPHRIVMAADGRQAYVSELRSHSVTAIETATHAVASFFAGRMPWGIALAPEPDTVFVANRASGLLGAIDLATKRSRTIHVGREPVEVVVSPDGGMAYVTSTLDNTVVPIALPALDVQAPIRVGMSPRGLAMAPDGRTIFVANSHSDSISAIDAATHLVVATIDVGRATMPTDVAVTPDGTRLLVVTHAGPLRVVDVATRKVLEPVCDGGQSYRVTIGPPIIVTDHAGSDDWLTIAEDEDLSALGFGRYVTFNGGVLRATADWRTPRCVSLLASGGAIDTRHHHVEIAGGVMNDGLLVKRGRGTLTLSGDSRHPASLVEEGTLAVHGAHAGRVVLGPVATLAGTGTVGDVEAIVGTISPGGDSRGGDRRGVDGRGVDGGSSGRGNRGEGSRGEDSRGDDRKPGTLRATNVTMGGGHQLVIDLGGAAHRFEGDCLAVDGTAALGGATLVLRPATTMAAGRRFAIVTNAVGGFAGLAEGATVRTSAGSFHLTYRGGLSGRDVVLTALPA